MEIWVNLEFEDGDFQKGFRKIKLKIDDLLDNNQSPDIQAQLPPAHEIPTIYELWKNLYYSLLKHPSRGFKDNQLTNISINTCFEYAQYLQEKLNQWLQPIQSQLESVITSNPDTEIRLVLNTHQITSEVTKNILHRIPWQEWHLFPEHSSAEAALCFKASVQNSAVPSIQSNSDTFRRVKIISIFGDSESIDTQTDEELIKQLEKRAAESISLKEPTLTQLETLWNEPCDILFFAGHSATQDDGQTGIIKLNSDENLNLEAIKKTLRAAIKQGLKLAIFNSCDGLGLARQLADLNLPYMIVWREPVPDKIAQQFLNFFLSGYSRGKSLFTAVREARDKLEELTKKPDGTSQLPGVDWLPVICKNTLELPPSWEDLGGLSGKLPESPYQGLFAFGEENAEYFFGRENFVDELVAAVETKALVPVVGASGSGKSSVVFAGLVPSLRKQGNVKIASFRPGNNPFDNLAIALCHHYQPPVPPGELPPDKRRQHDRFGIT